MPAEAGHGNQFFRLSVQSLTVANLIKHVNEPTLIVSLPELLAADVCTALKGCFHTPMSSSFTADTAQAV